ncbi:MAG: hypothetical protein QOC61_335 [Acidobacteriota bacterium]|nr:hypothetical protein [Acidobacteriota bacterium]
MFSLMLKKALPFTLTFVVGASLGGLFKPRGGDAIRWASWENTRREFTFGEGHDHGHCPMHRRYLVAESKPLVILFQPDAVLPRGLNTGKEDVNDARALVTFGADAKVHEVKILNSWHLAPHEFEELTKLNAEKNGIWTAVAGRAARNIEFTPEILNSVPVSVTREVEIHFIEEGSDLRLPFGANRERN